jgi:hypothetical protein
LKLMCACRSKAVSAASTRHRRARSLFNVVDFGMNIQAATEAARFTKRDFAGCGVRCGNWIAADVTSGASADPVAGLRWSKSSEQYGKDKHRRGPSTPRHKCRVKRSICEALRYKDDDSVVEQAERRPLCGSQGALQVPRLPQISCQSPQLRWISCGSL